GVAEKVIDPILAERIPVVVFGSPSLDVHRIDPSTLVLSGAAVTKNDDGTIASYRDVDGDGVIDLVASFPASWMRLGTNSTRATLSARTVEGTVLWGTGPVVPVESLRAARRRDARTDASLEKLPPRSVGIDILPFDRGNRIELGNRGTVPVAVL